MAKKLWQSAALNNMQYRLYYEWIEELAVSVYRWQGLPTEIDVRFLETTLFERALSIFFHDEEETKILVDELFNGITPESEEQQESDGENTTNENVTDDT